MKNKKKTTPLPSPIHAIPVAFKVYGRRYTSCIKIFKNGKDLNLYYRKVVISSQLDPDGVYAAAIFDAPDAGNKNSIGEMVFSLENLHPSLIGHEAVHLVFNYYHKTHGLNFANRRREESFCRILEILMDATYEYIEKHKIPYKASPEYQKS